ncbi:Six-hairpin glycosidase [Lindgomyces ingoldianus]|uniref:Six-hairpin glycosidase n=1 Tax=Lindgomyces ingoldianus TaxID=673940 RepID=A0ACB6QA11_9PLEO|nr:Six-hairpin glycosidase [Lindgomyces ingoldianus]KAF2462980.1 Six-hairpin glycosidase [Lindgomyces ingoldianus]
MFVMKYYKSLFLLPLLQVSPVIADYNANAEAAIKTLNNKWYDTNTGLWNKLWWQSGNMVTTIANFGIHDNNFKQTAKDIVANTYAKSANAQGHPGWKNDYYDDEGWWALGWIASYDLTNDVKYLNTAKDIFEDMTGGHTTPCGGGIWWDKKKTSIAAISNELFLSVAAHLANRVSGNDKQNYVNWAKSEWEWFYHSGIINSENVINDGIDKGTCKNDGKKVYTYNQGVILGGLAELAKATGDGGYIDNAKKIANGAINKLTKNGILTEDSSSLDEQGAQFKGVFVRGLIRLHQQSPTQSFSTFLKTNADSLWSKDKTGDGVLGPLWQGPAANANAASHAAGIDCLVAAAQA